jgi:hypothetical protein
MTLVIFPRKTDGQDSALATAQTATGWVTASLPAADDLTHLTAIGLLEGRQHWDIWKRRELVHGIRV